VLARVAAGEDTLERLAVDIHGSSADATLLALGELEVGGWLQRGDGGRYVVAPSSQVARSRGAALGMHKRQI
jgi:hypothetical protein